MQSSLFYHRMDKDCHRRRCDRLYPLQKSWSYFDQKPFPVTLSRNSSPISRKTLGPNMAWHEVTNQSANGNIASVLQSTKGINVLSPTWFYLNDNSGGIAFPCQLQLRETCHQNGIEVWALVSNLENPDVNTTVRALPHLHKR